jgi:hypothetical protein
VPIFLLLNRAERQRVLDVRQDEAQAGPVLSFASLALTSPMSIALN